LPPFECTICKCLLPACSPTPSDHQ
jgi:hypothetical protein